MQDAQSSPTKVFRHPFGLPGKKIKLSKENQLHVPTSERPSRSTEQNDARKRERSPLGITLDTGVSRHAGGKPEQTFPTIHQSSNHQWHYDGTRQEQVFDLLPTRPSPVTELSPFDREVPVILSNQTTPKFPIEKTQGVDDVQTSKMKVLEKANDNSFTPAIVLDSPNSMNSQQPDAPRAFARATSSIYTQAAPSSGKCTPAPGKKGFPRLNLASIPPIPKLGTPFSSIKTPMSIKTPTSSTTTESESDDPDSAIPSKRGSPADARSRAVRASTDIVPPTPRRSIGWWNLILSPFEAKRSTLGSVASKETTYVTDPDAPELPVLNRAAPMGSTEAELTGPDARASLMTIPHRHTIPYVGEAAKYYNPNERFGEEVPVSPMHEENDRVLSSGHIQASNAATSPDQMAKEQIATKKSPSEDTREEAGKASNEATPAPHSARTIATATPVNHAQHEVAPALATHCNGTVRRSLQPASGAVAGKHVPVAHTDSTSPTTPETIFSPGVVEVADARHFQSAHSVHTKNIQPTSQTTRKEQKTLKDRPTHDNKTVAPNPQKPIESDRIYSSDESAESHRTVKNEQQIHWNEKSQSDASVLHHVDNRFRFERRKAKTSLGAKNRLLLIIAAGGLLFIVLLTVILCLTVTQHHSDMPVAATWLNLSGYPALPTGIATIAPPSVKAQSSCVSNTDFWTCSLPKEQQVDNAPNSPDQPNMRLEIRFTGSQKLLMNSSSKPLIKKSFQPRSVTAAASERVDQRKQLNTRDGFDDLMKWAVPAAPSDDDQTFLGNTTDNIAEPFAGESTPFVISFLPTINAAPGGHDKRENSQDTSKPSPFQSFPPPLLASNNTAAEADLIPYPSAQPLKLFNRGKDSEHYGFYSYFDRSLFMKLSQSSENTTDPVNGNGGSAREGANARCTWSQTRFLVQIWTKPSSDQQFSPTSGLNPNSTDTATNFSGSGTFPLPVTVTLDRHGGDPSKKAVYCYGLDEYQRPISNQKGIVEEARDFGGSLVNPASGPFAAMTVSTKHGGYGGVDGGGGGCSCQWTNW